MLEKDPMTLDQSKYTDTPIEIGLDDFKKQIKSDLGEIKHAVNFNSIEINLNDVKTSQDDFTKIEKEGTKNKDDDQSKVEDNTDIERDAAATLNGVNKDSIKQGVNIEPSKLKKMKVWETRLIMVFSIVVPTIDVYTDLALIIRFLCSDNPKWAGLLLVPFLLNYFLTWLLWWRVDTMKSISWIAALLGCYPQFYAVKVIRMIWADFDLGMKKKRKMEREFSEFEVFAESVFTVLVMTYLMVRGRRTVIGEYEYLFFFTYATSILSASVGLAKCLKIGPCRVLGEGGALGGLFTGRFLLLLISVGITLIGKGFMLPTVAFIPYGALKFPSATLNYDINIIVALSCMFLPGLLVALLSLCHYRDIFKTLVSHPSLLLMPVFTHYTFTINNKCCSRKEDSGNNEASIEDDGNNQISHNNTRKNYGRSNDTSITFSRRWTVINMAVSAIGLAIFYLYLNQLIHPAVLLSTSAISLPIEISGALLTLLFLFLESWYLCIPCSPDLQVAVLKVHDPLTEYVVDKDHTGVNKIITMQEWRRKKNKVNGQLTEYV